jgi:hypothetical protein
VLVWKRIREIILRSGRKLRGQDHGCAKDSFCWVKVGEFMGSGMKEIDKPWKMG